MRLVDTNAKSSRIKIYSIRPVNIRENVAQLRSLLLGLKIIMFKTTLLRLLLLGWEIVMLKESPVNIPPIMPINIYIVMKFSPTWMGRTINITCP
jgi:hypothetical protein